jgi:adenylate cyclase
MSLARWSRTLLPCLALGAVVALRASEPSFVRDLQLRSFDQLQRIWPRPYQVAPVRIVDIDDASLEKVGQWPWPRSEIARLVDRLTELGAAAIVFDVVFAEPDRTAPLRIVDGWGEHVLDAALARRLRALPDPDAVLAASIAQAPVVTGFALTQDPGGRTPLARHGVAQAGDDPRQFLLPYRGAVSNLPELEQAARGNGSFAIDHDPDGLIRRVPFLYRLGDDLYPSLAAEALRVALGASTYLIRSSGASGSISFGERSGILGVRLTPEVEVPTDAEGRLWLHFTEPQPWRYVPAWQVLDGSADAGRIEGQIALIGTSATGLKDIRATPLDPAAPGVVVHAEAIEQALLGHFLRRPDWASGAEILFTLVWGVLLILLIRRTGAIWSAAVGVLGIIGAAAASWIAFREALLLFDPVFPSLAGASVYLTGSLVNYLHAEVERSRIRGAFSHYLAPALVRELAQHPEKLRLGGETRDMTILFMDIRGFTTLSEQMKPQKLIHVLNSFLTPMTERILERSGTIDKYMGDCIMSFWNAPLDNAQHASDACAAALAMVEELDRVNERLFAEAPEPYLPLQVGIGLNSGSCCVGNMGSEQRFDYSVLGDEVNLASRLEGQSKFYGVTIVIGENTRERAPGLATLELDLIRVKGKSQPVRIHALLGNTLVAESSSFQAQRAAHDEMLKLYRAREFRRALEALEDCAQGRVGLRTLYDIYRERVLQYLETPPPDDWDAVYVAKSK